MQLKNYFDDFDLVARALPVATVVIPLLFVGIVKGFLQNQKLDGYLYGLIFVIIFMVLAKFVRGCGKKVEKALYASLGAKPTTIIIRFSDNRIDALTKVRYHKVLNNWCKDIVLPLSLEEENKNSDTIYESAMNQLRVYANNNRENAPRVYQELKEYNFWRNLYGIKWYAVVGYFLLAVREFLLIPNFSVKMMIVHPASEYLSFVIMVLGCLVIFGFVKKKLWKREHLIMLRH